MLIYLFISNCLPIGISIAYRVWLISETVSQFYCRYFFNLEAVIMFKLSSVMILALLLVILLSGISHAILIDRGGGLVYDTDLDATWLQDPNYAKTTNYASADVYGRMTWADANTWAEDLTYYDSESGLTYDDWRLPTTINSLSSVNDFVGYSSEMAYMYYINLGYPVQPWYGTGPRAPNPPVNDFFPDLVFKSFWSGTQYNEENAWQFHFHFGMQDRDSIAQYHYAWAVRDGDVVAVPEPAMILLFGLGFIGYLATNNKKRIVPLCK